MTVKILGKWDHPFRWNYTRETLSRGPLATVQDSGLASSDMDSTPTQRLASLILQQPVSDWIGDRRDTGRSWRLIARDLLTATDGQIDVTAETLRGWSYRETTTAA